jgi:MFS family permease
MSDSLTPATRVGVLAIAFAGLVGAGFQLGLMPLASLSVSRDLMGEAFADGPAGEWFARYTAAIMLGAAVGGLVLGSLGDAIGRARATGVSILTYSLFGAVGGFATSQEQLLALRFLAGLGVGGMWPNGSALVAECWAGVSRPVAAGTIGMGINIGILCVSQVGRWHSVTHESWRWPLHLSAATLPLAVVALLFLPESPRWLARRTAGDRTISGSPTQELCRPPLLRRTLVGILLGTIPLLGAWAASKWMIPWADSLGGLTQPGYKAVTQGWWAVGAILGSFLGAPMASLFGRRTAYFLISLGSTALTCGIFLFTRPLATAFLPLVCLQGLITTLFFGWLPLCLPELFPTRVRATGSGIAYNFGRFATAVGVFATGTLMAWTGGDYSRVGMLTGLVYALGMVVIWWAPDTTEESLAD